MIAFPDKKPKDVDVDVELLEIVQKYLKKHLICKKQGVALSLAIMAMNEGLDFSGEAGNAIMESYKLGFGSALIAMQKNPEDLKSFTKEINEYNSRTASKA